LMLRGQATGTTARAWGWSSACKGMRFSITPSTG